MIYYVSNLLKAKHRDQIPGGLADKKQPSDFDPKALAEGIRVELEHTSNLKIAREIAMDHLREDPLYYKKLRKIEKPKGKALVIRLNDIVKARVKGAKGEAPKYGKYGAIVSSDSSFYPTEGGIRYIKRSELGSVGKIMERYHKKGVNVSYVPPSSISEQGRSGFDPVKLAGQRKTSARSEARLEKFKEKKAPAVIPQALVSELQTGPRSNALEILRTRVSQWTPLKRYRRTLASVNREELADLLASRRTISKRLRTAKTAKEKGAISKQAAEIQRRIDQIYGKAQPTKGGGLFDLTSHQVQEISSLPDIGVEATRRPMTYLLSLGWHKQDKGKNSLNTQESNALIHEYQGLISRTASQLASKFDLQTADRKDLFSLGATLLLEMAKEWKPVEPPSASNNFGLRVYGNLPYRIADEARRIAKERGATDILAEDLAEMPESKHGTKLTPSVRIETPEQYARRRELAGEVSQIFSNILSPLESAVVMARLNVLNPHTEGVMSAKLDTPTGKIAIEGVKPWHAVKDDVIGALGTMQMTEADQVQAAESLKKMPEQRFSQIFQTALNKLRTTDTVRGITPEDKAAIAELANLQRLYLEGVRHEIWDPSETIGKLKVKPKVPSPADLAALEQKYEALSEQITAQKDGKIRAKLAEKKQDIGRKLVQLRAQQKIIDRLHAETKASKREPISYAQSAVDFWQKNTELAAIFRIDLDAFSHEKRPVRPSITGENYRVPAHYVIPGVSLPTQVQQQISRAQILHGVAKNLQSKSVDALRQELSNLAKTPKVQFVNVTGQTRNDPHTLDVASRPREVSIRQSVYKQAIEHVLAQKVGSLTVKSFVLPYLSATIDALIEEHAVWVLNGY